MPFNEILMPEEIRLFLVDLLKEANAWPDAEELQQRMLVDLFTRSYISAGLSSKST
jgi:hypothetical protein